MSWHYTNLPSLPELAEASSAESLMGVDAWERLKSSLTQDESLWPDREMECSLGSQSGTTSGLSDTTTPLAQSISTGYEASENSLLSLEDSPAKTSAPLDQGQDWMELEADFGTRWQEWLAQYDHIACLWRTPQCSLFEVLGEFWEILPRWGIMRNGVCYPLPMPSGLVELRFSIISESASSSRLPTPTVCGNYNRKGASKTSGDGLATVVKRLPTPTASQRGDCPSEQRRNTPCLNSAVRRLPTPLASDNRNRGNLDNPSVQRRLEIGKQVGLSTVIGGPLNPSWTEWLMGWPTDWSAEKPLAMDKFQQWLASHGKSSPENSACP